LILGMIGFNAPAAASSLPVAVATLGTGYPGIKIRGITPQSLGGTLRQIQLVHFHEIFGQTAKAQCLVLVIDNLEDCDGLAVQA
jgi:hypothetical protein